MSLTKVSYSMVNGASINVLDFGADPTGNTDSAAAIQLALDALNETVASVSGAQGTFGTASQLYFPKGKYVISTTLTCLSNYLTITGENSLLIKASSFTGSSAFSTLSNKRSFRTEIYGLQFQNFEKAISLDTNNRDQSRIIIEKCSFIDITDTAITTIGPSCNALIQDCYFSGCKREWYTNCDVSVIRGGWIYRGLLTDNYDGGIINYGFLRMEDVLGVPRVQTVTEPAWVKNYGWVRCVRTRFGGENGAHAVVNNFKAYDFTFSNTPSYVSLEDCEIYTTSTTAIRLFLLPHALRVRACTGLSDSALIQWSSSVSSGTQASIIAAIPAGALERNQMLVDIGNNSVQYDPTPPIVPDNLLRWTYEYSGTFDLTIASATGAFGAITYANRQFNYVKKKEIIYIQGAVATNSITVSTASGAVILTGLPFKATASNSGTSDGSASLVISFSQSFTGDVPSLALVEANQSYINLFYRTTANGNTNSLDVSDLNTGSSANYMFISGNYKID